MLYDKVANVFYLCLPWYKLKCLCCCLQADLHDHCFRSQQILLCLNNIMKSLSVIWYVGEKIRSTINFILLIVLPNHFHWFYPRAFASLVAFVVKTPSTRLEAFSMGYMLRGILALDCVLLCHYEHVNSEIILGNPFTFCNLHMYVGRWSYLQSDISPLTLTMSAQLWLGLLE